MKRIQDEVRAILSNEQGLDEGYYAAHYTARERRQLSKALNQTLWEEVALFRTCIKKFFGLTARNSEQLDLQALSGVGRYTAWLEDRVRLNRFRNAFLYVIKAKFINENARRTRQLELAANPPSPGSILVTDESEDWSVISPKLEALDASTDGLAIKKMIAAGAGVPLHFLAEPESSTRTTAEAAGGPTYRRFEQRQHFFTWMMADLLRVVVTRRSLVDPGVDPQAPIAVKGADISARDNVALSMAAVNVGSLAEKLADMGLIGREEMLRVIYRFLGEPVDVPELLKGGSGVDRRTASPGSIAKGSTSRVKVDPETGELKPVAGNLA